MVTWAVSAATLTKPTILYKLWHIGGAKTNPHVMSVTMNAKNSLWSVCETARLQYGRSDGADDHRESSNSVSWRTEQDAAGRCRFRTFCYGSFVKTSAHFCKGMAYVRLFNSCLRNIRKKCSPGVCLILAGLLLFLIIRQPQQVSKHRSNWSKMLPAYWRDKISYFSGASSLCSGLSVKSKVEFKNIVEVYEEWEGIKKFAFVSASR